MAHIGKGMGMKLLAWSRTKPHVVDELGIEFTSDLGYLLAKSDIIMVALPFTPATKGLLNKKSVEKIKDNTIIVNVARAEVMEKELYGTLQNRLC